MTLTGAILAAGGFKETNGPVPPEELTYVRVVGRKKAGEVAVRAAGPEAQALSDSALQGLMARVAEFDRPETPYLSWAAPHLMGSYSPYNLLARVWEWHVIGGGEEGEAE